MRDEHDEGEMIDVVLHYLRKIDKNTLKILRRGKLMADDLQGVQDAVASLVGDTETLKSQMTDLGKLIVAAQKAGTPEEFKAIIDKLTQGHQAAIDTMAIIAESTATIGSAATPPVVVTTGPALVLDPPPVDPSADSRH